MDKEGKTVKEYILDLKAVAEYLSLNERTVYDLVKKNEIPAVRFGKQWRVKKEHLDLIFTNNYKEIESKKERNNLIHMIPGFLGNKTEMLERLKKEIANMISPGDTILDIFAGSNIVGYSLKKDYTIYSNDFQEFSHTIGSALINNEIKDIDSINAEEIINSKYYSDNKLKLFSYLSDLSEAEMTFFNNKNYLKYKDFCEQTPYIAKTHLINEWFYKGLVDLIHLIQNNGKKKLYALFSTYYINSYFGVEQCVEIDSIFCAIDKLFPIKNQKRAIYLSALIYSLYSSVSSVGSHFAQPQLFSNETGIKKIMQKHKQSIIKSFTNKIMEVKAKLVLSKYNNKSFNVDFKEFLSDKNRKKSLKDVKLIYVDSPYTIDHYSRFYHIPETLVKYDYPECEGKGRYRNDRFQSNFCIKTKAREEFEKLLILSHDLNSKMVISYSDSYRSILNVQKDIISLCEKYYKKVRGPINIEYSYSGLGRSSGNDANEIIITCEGVI